MMIEIALCEALQSARGPERGYVEPKPLAWWVRHPHLATAVLGTGLLTIGMIVERLT